jgi:hypothetical protein
MRVKRRTVRQVLSPSASPSPPPRTSSPATDYADLRNRRLAARPPNNTTTANASHHSVEWYSGIRKPGSLSTPDFTTSPITSGRRPSVRRSISLRSRRPTTPAYGST